MVTFTLTGLSMEEVQAIAGAVTNLPYRVAAPIVAKIDEQMIKQTTQPAPQAAEPAEPAAPAEQPVGAEPQIESAGNYDPTVQDGQHEAG